MPAGSFAAAVPVGSTGTGGTLSEPNKACQGTHGRIRRELSANGSREPLLCKIVLNSFDPDDGSLRAFGARCRLGAGSLTKDEPSAFAPPPAFGPFRVLHQIGVGALGPVFRTYEPTRDRLVAVKVFRLDITPEQAKTLADELSHAAEAGLFHPSIVEPIAAGVEGTVAYRAEEYVAAETLDVALRHYAPATVDKALPFITQLAGAIDFARAAGVGHGALHPRDVFVTPEETRATGFGVVDALERVGIRAPVRRPYSAPERIEGRAWGTPADVFSLGAIAYELLTGRRPSGTGGEIGTLAGANVGPHADLVLAVLAMAMDPDPSRRHQTALAFAGALEAASRGESSAVPVAAPAPPPAKQSLPAAAAPVAATVPVPVKAKPAAAPVVPDDDISTERDEDEAQYELSLRESKKADAAPLFRDKDEEEEEDERDEDEPEAEADRFLVDAGAVASDDTSERYRDDFRASPADRVAARDVEPVSSWEPNRGQRMLDSPSEYPASVVPTPGSRVVPLASMLSVGLLVGFAVGYGVGTRNPAPPPDATTAVRSKPGLHPLRHRRAATTASRPCRLGTATTPQPSAAPPPVPTDAAPAAPARRPAATTGRMVVESIPTRAGVMVNGRWRGRTPLAIEQLPFGQYSVRVVQPGYVTAEQDFRLSAGDPIETLSVRLQRQPATRTVTSPPTPTANLGATGRLHRDDLRRLTAPGRSGSYRREGGRDDTAQPAGSAGREPRGQARAAGASGLVVEHAGNRRADGSRDGLVGAHSMKATLALENGIWYDGEAAGAAGDTGGEVVFNTSMTGYQEVLTDPSYAGQIVTMTTPEIGNYGVTDEDHESRAPKVAGFIIRDESPIASNWRADGTLRDYLVSHGIVAISDIDTRALTRVLRSSGVMRGIIATGEVDPRDLVERARGLAPMEGSDLVLGVTCDRPFDWTPTPSDEFTPEVSRPARRPLRVAAYDFGMKWNILRRFTTLRL